MTKLMRILSGPVLAMSMASCSMPGSSAADEAARQAEAVIEPPITIPIGTRLRVSLVDAVSSTASVPGSVFQASLAEPVLINGDIILDRGLTVRGRVVDAVESGRVSGRASLRLILTAIETATEPISVETQPFVVVAEGAQSRDAAIIAGSAGVGAAVGAIAGGARDAGLGALIGGGVGTGAVLATKGEDLHYPSGTRLNFTLASSIQVPSPRPTP